MYGVLRDVWHGRVNELCQNILKNFAPLVNRQSPRAFFLHQGKAVKAVGDNVKKTFQALVDPIRPFGTSALVCTPL